MKASTVQSPSNATTADFIEKSFQFKDFIGAFGFMTQVALAAEKMDHHPDWTNVYSSVTIRWSTHTAHGLTDNDWTMAAKCDEIAVALLNIQ